MAAIMPFDVIARGKITTCAKAEAVKVCTGAEVQRFKAQMSHSSFVPSFTP